MNQTQNAITCINLDAPNYGVNFSCVNPIASFLYNITILRQSNFSTGNQNETLSASGMINVSMDSRTDLTSISFNVSSEGTTQNLIIAKEGIRGILTETFLKDTEFVVSGNYVNVTNLTYLIKGSNNIYVNLSAHPINLSFKIWGFQADTGNDLNFFEYFNNSNQSVNNLTYSGIEVIGEYDNFETNSSKWSIQSSTLDTLSLTSGLVDNYYLFEGSIGVDSDKTGELDNSIDSNFDLKNYTTVIIELFARNFVTVCNRAGSMSHHNYVYVSDGTNDVILKDFNDEFGFGDNSRTELYNFNISLKQVDLTHYSVFLDNVLDSTKDLNSLNPTLKWYLKFKKSMSTNIDGCLGSGEMRVYRIQSSGLWLNKSAQGTEYDTSGTIRSEIIATTSVDNNYTAAWIYSNRLDSANITYELSATNGTLGWEDVTNFVSGVQRYVFTTQGNELAWRINLTGSNISSPIVYDLNIQVIPTSVENVTIDFGIKQDIFTFTGVLNSTTSPRDVTINTTVLDDYNSTYTPIKISSGNSGQIQVNNLVINSSINPVSLNESRYEDCSICELNFSFAGNAIKVLDLAFDFLGSWNYTATAHFGSSSVSHKIQIYYSKFNVSLPSGIFWYDVFPASASSKNVTPDGQRKTRPIWNITSYAYDIGFDVYVKTNETLNSCFNITYGNSSNYTLGRDYEFNLNTSYQQILDNVSVSDWKGIWNWWNLYSCSGRYYLPYVYFSAICNGCYFDIDQLDYYNVLVE